MRSTPKSRCHRLLRRVYCHIWCGAIGAAGLVLGSTTSVEAQTLTAVKAIDERICGGFLNTSCRNIETNRVSRTFTRAKFDRTLFSSSWSTSVHCIYVEVPDQICHRSVSIATDRAWNRIVWGQSDKFLASYGTTGSGTGQFAHPTGSDISRLEGQWHIAFVADAGNNRIVVLALGYIDKSVRWLGTITAVETGQGLSGPNDVAWDPVETWSMSDDRIFIVDSGNDRIVVYQIGFDFPASGPRISTLTYLSSFGAEGSDVNQFNRPMGITVQSFGSLAANVYVTDTGNDRISLWYYDTGSPLTPDLSPLAAYRSAPVLNSNLIGITQDAFGDVIAADYRNNRLVKFRGYSLGVLKAYGGSSWATGNFVSPTDAEVVWQHKLDAAGNYIKFGLAYVGSTEQWGDTTGIQQHRMGLDVDSLSVNVPYPAAREATSAFLMTAHGSYRTIVKNSQGTAIRTFGWTDGASSGWKGVYWNGRNDAGVLVGPGTYSILIEHRSAYGGSETPRATGPRAVNFIARLLANISGPSAISGAGTYTWRATASNCYNACDVREFYRREVGEANWQRIGGDTAYTHAVNGSDFRKFELKLVASDSFPEGVETTERILAVEINATALIVSIQGPTSIEVNTYGTWMAYASGGVQPHAHRWLRKNYYTQVFEQVGEGQSYTGTSAVCNTFDLVLSTAEAGGQEAAAQRSVEVTSPDPNGCMFAPEGRLTPGADDAPTMFLMRQNVAGSTGNLGTRDLGLRRAGSSESLAAGSLDYGSRSAQVRAEGITSLSFGIPRTAAIGEEPNVSTTPQSRLGGRGAPSGTSTVGPTGGRAGAPVAVRIRIFNIGGRLVRVAVDETLGPGYYNYTWDGRNDSGTALPPGVYVAIMTAPGFRQTTKLILTK